MVAGPNRRPHLIWRWLGRRPVSRGCYAGAGLPLWSGKLALLSPAGDGSGVMVAAGNGAATVVPKVSVAGLDMEKNGLKVCPVAAVPM